MLNKYVVFLYLFTVAFSCKQQSDTTTENKPNTPNALINETSPYLLQHAYNPVDWKAWNTESLELAKQENKLIVISVGYSACHWCHVMEEESFENDSVAKLMNANFINIKVDREERPDVDQIYMNAVQLMTGSGGWPLNCITLPDGRPVFGGTYFTKLQWTKILEDMSTLYKNDPDKVIAYAEQLTEGIKKSDLITVNKDNIEFDSATIQAMVTQWQSELDFTTGGQTKAPKFPMPGNLNFLLRYSVQTDNKRIQDFVMTTLDHMAYGGIYDQIGGGFSRYSVDDKWHIPHFEKMLYDNAQLVSLYSKAYQLTKNESYRKVVTETLEFIERELTHENGGFYSSLDADSKTKAGELEEGAFYAWTKEELKIELGNDFELFKSYYNINDTGYWENEKYILFKTKSDTDFIQDFNISFDDFYKKRAYWKDLLFKVRANKERPRTDDKILTSWNALMLEAYVDAYRVFGVDAYLDKAIKNANFIKTNQLLSTGALYHNFKDNRSTITGFLEDYSQTISAFIALYQVTLDENWLDTSNALVGYVDSHFKDNDTGMFYFTSDETANLIARKIQVVDNVIPSSNAVLAESLFELSHYYSNTNYRQMADQMLRNMNSEFKNAPSAYSHWLSLYLNYSNPYYEVAVSGPEALAKLDEMSAYYLPNILVAGALNESELPIMEQRFIPDDTYIYVCVDGACKLPVEQTNKAVSQLSK